MELTSIILPTYKRSDKLPNAVNCIFSQWHEKWELIIIDDNEANSIHQIETEQIALSFRKKDFRIKYIKHNQNLGVSAARNSGIRIAKGKYIAFMDDDDLWTPDKLKKQLQLFNKDETIGLVYCNAYIVKNGNTITHKIRAKYKGYIFNKMLSRYCITTTNSIVVKKECFEKVGLFDEQLTSREDHDMFLRISRFYKFGYVNEYLVYYNVHTERLSTDIGKKIDGWEKFIKKWEVEYTNNKKAKYLLLHNYHYDLGKLYYNNKHYRLSRYHFINAIKNNCFSIKSIIYIFLAAMMQLNNIKGAAES